MIDSVSAPQLVCSPRLRRTPFSRRVEAAGVKAYTVYNHMLLPSVFRSVEEDYAHLKSAVQIWDVSCERQIEIAGPDAAKLVQMSTPRDLTRMQDDQCYYIPNVDAAGRLLNDPVLVKLSDDRYWVSIADSDMLFYYRGLATAAALDVSVFEPDVSPLAIQGPSADKLIERVFGEDIVNTRFFRHQRIRVADVDMLIARSGWSLQGGFEIYLDGSKHGESLWDTLFEAGEDLDVRAGCPNSIERIEGGLLSFGSDMTNEHTPYEAGLGKYCQLDAASACLGCDALSSMSAPVRQIRAVEIDGGKPPALTEFWPLHDRSDSIVGRVSSAAYSPDLNKNIAIAMVDRAHWDEGTSLYTRLPDGSRRDVSVRRSFWV
ncbi:dimethylsulfoniopropionate demethylase [Chromatiales bacterium (ex Bugula neritina AB1)]|nr:dimethylsulfoniopropionate demethylase [Chromatiales bacterium (ex Bugula neritina AB1)]